MPVINKFQPRTYIFQNNPLKGQKKKMKFKRNNTFEKNALNKKTEEVNSNIKKIKSPNKKEIKKEILRKNIAFEKIFKRLDNDKDGEISKNNIDLYGISKRMLKILAPIMDEIKEGGTISSEEFVKK